MTRVPVSPAPEASAPSSATELHVPAEASRLPELVAFAKEAARCARMGETAAARLRLILEELFANVYTHGSAGRAQEDEPLTVDICCALRAQDRVLFTTFRDTGPAFNPLVPLAALAPLISHNGPPPGALLLPLEDLPLGGQGLHLVRTLAVEPRYARAEGHNIFTFSLALE